MPTVRVQFIVAAKSGPQIKRHLLRFGIATVATVRQDSNKMALDCTVYTSEPDRVLDVLLKSAFKRLLVPNDEGVLITEDWA